MQNLENFEKTALESESPSLPVNSVPVDNLMNLGGSSVKIKEFNQSPTSMAYPDKYKVDQVYGSLNSEHFVMDCTTD